MQRVRIISRTGKWINFVYTASNARKRASIKKLIHDFENGNVEIVNPALLKG